MTPISQNEYFQFYAFFNNTSETGRSGRGKTAPLLQYLSPEDRGLRAYLKENVNTIEKEMYAPDSELDSKQNEWEAATLSRIGAQHDKASFGPWWKLGTIKRNGRQAYDTELGPEGGVDLEKEYDGVSWESFELPDAKVVDLPDTVGATFFYRRIECSTATQMRLFFGSDDAIKVYVNGKEILAEFAARAAAADQESATAKFEKGTNELLIKIVNTGGIGGVFFRPGPESVGGLPIEIAESLRTPSVKRSEGQAKSLKAYFRSTNWNDWTTLEQRKSGLEQQLAQLDAKTVPVMVMDDLPPNKKRRTVMLERGGYDKPTDTEVQTGVPDVLPAISETGDSNRLTLARWLVQPDHPLTARVTVNRYWQMFFGQGIVQSSEDFGSQGTRPSHPELLDYLARTFVDGDWNVKSLHKEIVMSATYQQSSIVSADALNGDPKNRWLARAPRYRLPSWMLRDQALSISGLLNPRLGGPSVKPYQPAGIWADATFGKIKYSADRGDANFRRSLYVFWRRIVGPTMFFDEAKRQTCEVKPSRTNTPLHALTTLNETLFFESARAMAERVLESGALDEERIRFAFGLATSRAPTDSEFQTLSRKLKSFREDFNENVDEAKRLISVGESTSSGRFSPQEHASYTLLCSMILNLDETLTKH